MILLESLKKTVAQAIRRTGFTTIIGRKVYSAEELAREVEKETEIGKKMVQLAIRGTLERYSKGK